MYVKFDSISWNLNEYSKSYYYASLINFQNYRCINIKIYLYSYIIYSKYVQIEGLNKRIEEKKLNKRSFN